MSKKCIFLNIFSKITIFVCVFCTFSAWADTTCDTNFTPIMGNSIQNGTPTPTTPVEVINVGNKTKNLFDKNTMSGPIAGGYSEKISTVVGTQYIVKNFNRSDRLDSTPVKGYTESGTEVTISRTYYPAGTSWNNCEHISFTIPENIVSFVFGIRPLTSGNNVHWEDVMLVEGSAAPTEYIPYGYRIPGTSIYLDEPLRKVGNYADELRPDGTVIRRVGVKVLNGTENWTGATPGNGNYFHTSNSSQVTGHRAFVSNYYKQSDSTFTNASNYTICAAGAGMSIQIRDERFENVSAFKSWLAQQYAAGTPVTVYYPLATEVVKSWSCGPIADIKIATTKMVEDEFAVAEANLAATVQTIESVVSRTISQTEQIQVLQDTKQTRPDESCPANMKCLLVQDEDGTPHWYPIIEP